MGCALLYTDVYNRTPMGDKLQILGNGLYQLSDVARYTQLHQGRLRNWFTHRSGRNTGPVFSSDYPRLEGSHVVSFLDMVDAWMVGELRAKGVSMPTIREAHTALKGQLRTSHPFAHSSIYTDGRRVFTIAAQYVQDQTLSEVVSKQFYFNRVRELLTKIDYSAKSQLAERWNISEGVVIDPRVGFGQPVIKGTGVTTLVIASAYKANHENASLVGELFGITHKDVSNAVNFEEEYGHHKAA